MDRMEPEIKRMKFGVEAKEDGKQEQTNEIEAPSSTKNLEEEVVIDNSERCLSSSLGSNELGIQGYQLGNDSENTKVLVTQTSSGSPVSSEHITNVQLLSLASSIQNPSISESDGKNDLFNDKIGNFSKAEQRASIQNGSGQKLESIIGRLSSDRVVTSLVDHDEDALICKADASTQTFPDFVKIVKCLVFRRMKQLEQSLIRDAVTDSVLNGKLLDLQKENRDLHKCVKKLQDSLDIIIQSLKSDESNSITRVKELLESAQCHHGSDFASENSSPIRKQSAVVTPYHVQSAESEAPTQGNMLNTGRSRREPTEVPQTHGKVTLSSNVAVHENAHNLKSMGVQCNPATRHGPQIKYVPQRLHQGPHHSGLAPSQLINLAQGGIVMQRLPVQRASALEFVSRPQPGPVIYTTQSVQVTGPRMSTIPPQPQQSSQHGGQRPIVSPSGIGTRLSQPSTSNRPSGNLLHLQGSSPQTVHYIPHNVMHYMTPIQQNVPFNGHRVVTQGPPSELREHLALPQPNAPHGEYQKLHPTTSLPPPPYQVPRSQTVNHSNISQVSRVPTDKPLPPKLQVNITVSGNGIVLSWDFESEPAIKVPAIECYHLFASQDSPTPPVLSSEWKKIGVVKALPLPMACTLTQFVSGNSYHFAVLAVDVNGREGPLSNSCTVRLNN